MVLFIVIMVMVRQGAQFQTFSQIDDPHGRIKGGNSVHPHRFERDPDPIVKPTPGEVGHLFRGRFVGGRAASGADHHLGLNPLAADPFEEIFQRQHTHKRLNRRGGLSRCTGAGDAQQRKTKQRDDR